MRRLKIEAKKGSKKRKRDVDVPIKVIKIMLKDKGVTLPKNANDNVINGIFAVMLKDEVKQKRKKKKKNLLSDEDLKDLMDSLEASEDDLADEIRRLIEIDSKEMGFKGSDLWHLWWHLKDSTKKQKEYGLGMLKEMKSLGNGKLSLGDIDRLMTDEKFMPYDKLDKKWRSLVTPWIGDDKSMPYFAKFRRSYENIKEERIGILAERFELLKEVLNSPDVNDEISKKIRKFVTENVESVLGDDYFGDDFGRVLKQTEIMAGIQESDGETSYGSTDEEE